MSDHRKPRVLLFIVAYNAERTITDVVRRIPTALLDSFEVDVLIIDDASRDATFELSHQVSKALDIPFPIHALFNPVNQGYGGNQKLGYHYAIQHAYDFVALLHGDGQYAPERLPALLEPLRRGEAAAVFGSRMLTRMGALRGGMPLYKYVGNKVLTWIQNKLLRSILSEFHSGYRAYSVSALAAIPFDRNTNDFHFDTEIIIQLLIGRFRILEVPIPTYYGDEICHVNGLTYAVNVVIAALKARLQDMSLFYDRRFDCAPADRASPYTLKLAYSSPHTLTLDRVRPGALVLDLGCAGGYMGWTLKERRQCLVTGVDAVPAAYQLDAFHMHDLNTGLPNIPIQQYDFVLILDVIEHLTEPEAFLDGLKRALALSPSTEIIISTANVASLPTRLMLLFGQFNYGKRGILDLTHRRLFTFHSLRRAMEQAGFIVLETAGVPAPFPLAVGDNAFSRFLLAVNHILIKISRGLFAYQIFMRAQPAPSLELLLNAAHEESRARAAQIENFRANDVEALSL